MAFIRKHIKKAYVITGEPRREERWDYPLEALRETVINAIVHRDYASSSDSIVKIFNDRIEVFNPGSLPTGLTVEKLLTGDYVSVIRNRKIADIFKEIGLIEKYGTGIKRILQSFENYGLPAPRFEEIAGGFRVTACKDIIKAITLEDKEAEDQKLPSMTPSMIPTLPDKPRRKQQRYRLTEKLLAQH